MTHADGVPPGGGDRFSLGRWRRVLLAIVAVIVASVVVHRGALAVAGRAEVEGAIAARDIALAVAKEWNPTEAIQRARPELVRQHSAENLAGMIAFFSRKMGRVTSCGPAEAKPATLHLGTKGFLIVADYRIPCSFEQGHGRVLMSLVRQSGEWRFTRFQIDSPELAK